MRPVHALSAAHDRIVLQGGLLRLLIAFLAGALAALAMPPFSAFPVLAISFPILVWLIDGAGAAGGVARSAISSAAVGWWFGFGYFLTGLWWIGSAFMVDAEAHAWLMPFAVLGLPAGLALFHAAGAAVARLLWSPGVARIAALAAGMGGAEWLRGHILTGFPWNAFGYALADTTYAGQLASVIGVEGLTFVVLLVFAAPATLLDADRRLRPTVIAAAALALITGFGAARLANAEPSFRDGITVRIMQPNVPQDDKFLPAEGARILERYITLSETATGPERVGIEDVSLLVWPESAFPFVLAETPEALARIAAFLPDDTLLVTGAIRADDTAGERRFFNSIQAVGGDGAIRASYDKVHLVPFGEYLPLQSRLESLGVTQITRLPGGFSAGMNRRPLDIGSGLTAVPLICYEAIFAAEPARSATRPDVIVNVTNDGWFGMTPGPYQHLAQARARAIEQGLPLIRAANTGISAMIDAYGRTVSSLALGTAGSLDAPMPMALKPTFFGLTGMLAPCGIFIMCFSFAAIVRSRI